MNPAETLILVFVLSNLGCDLEIVQSIFENIFTSR